MACSIGYTVYVYIWYIVYNTLYMVHIHMVPTSRVLWNILFIGPWKQDVGSHVDGVRFGA